MLSEMLALFSTWDCGRVTLFTISKVGWNSGFDFLPKEEKEKKANEEYKSWNMVMQRC